jgi:hypothetical protein
MISVQRLQNGKTSFRSGRITSCFARQTGTVPIDPRFASRREQHLAGRMVTLKKREGRFRSAERVEAHLQVHLVSRYFFQPGIADGGHSMKGVRNVESVLRHRARPS